MQPVFKGRGDEVVFAAEKQWVAAQLFNVQRLQEQHGVLHYLCEMAGCYEPGFALS